MKRNWKRLALVLCMAALCISLLGITAMAADPATVQIPVQVKLTGTQPEQAETFTVELTAEEAGAPMPTGTADGKFLLDLTGASTGKLEISYDKLGIYHYTARQLPGNNADCYQDESVYHITVQVTNNENYDGYSLIVAVRRNDEAEKRTEILFENRYANPTTVQLRAGKTMDGQTPKDGAFSFELTDEASKKQTVTNKGKDVTFAAISYDAAGEYTYTIREIPGKDEEIIYDETVYTAKVTVKKDDKGNYQAKTEYFLKDKALEEAPTFKNKTKAPTPQTGDTFNPVLVVAVMAVCLAAIAVLLLAMRKRKKA